MRHFVYVIVMRHLVYGTVVAISVVEGDLGETLTDNPRLRIPLHSRQPKVPFFPDRLADTSFA